MAPQKGQSPGYRHNSQSNHVPSSDKEESGIILHKDDFFPPSIFLHCFLSSGSNFED